MERLYAPLTDVTCEGLARIHSCCIVWSRWMLRTGVVTSVHVLRRTYLASFPDTQVHKAVLFSAIPRDLCTESSVDRVQAYVYQCSRKVARQQASTGTLKYKGSQSVRELWPVSKLDRTTGFWIRNNGNYLENLQ
jgi:hypothetical protein